MRQAAGAPAPLGVPGARSDEPAGQDLAALERAVLARWARDDVPRRSLARTADGPRWSCWENPQTAGGMPGIHQLPAVAIRDLYQRTKRMQGFDVARRGGWNCHGQAVEVAVEKELGLSGRPDIEAYGIERFVARCREFALRHADAIAALTTRMGCWAGAEAAARSMDGAYVESAWSSLRRIFDAHLLERSRRVVPYCPRCQTPLAAHDLRGPGALKTMTMPAPIVRFRLATLPGGTNSRLQEADLLVRTTAPWTLAANAAIAVHPHQIYALARRAGQDDRVIVAQSRLAEVLGEDWHVAARVAGGDLAGATYRALPVVAGEPAQPRPVISDFFVTADDGTGLRHLAPAYGADDLAVGLAHGLEIPDPIGPDGRFDPGLTRIGGLFFAQAGQALTSMLSDRGLIFACRPHHDAYPHCWRCGTPLLFRALPAWHIRTTSASERLIAAHERVRWEPDAGGRADGGPDGAWLGTEADWTLSRTRYWGTPLPLWECPRGHVTCVESLAELSELAGRDVTALDPHRPHIDAVTIICPRCGAPGRRVPDVIDARYDAGSMPFAQPGVVAATAADTSDLRADLVAAGADQAGEWFGALMTVGVLAYGRPAFGTALRIGAVLDDAGRPMTRGLGNLVEPQPLIERYGADTVRWFFAAATPGAAVEMSEPALAEIAATVLLSYRNAAVFLAGAAVASASPGVPWRPGNRAAPPPGTRPLLDRWILSELQSLVGDVTADLASYDSAAATAHIAGFIDALSSRYLCWCGRRFGPDATGPSRLAALATLHECLEVLTRAMAPLTPLLTDHVWQLLGFSQPDRPDSVHLAAWPVPVPALIDAQLTSQVSLVGRLADLGRSARAAAAIGVCRPLARAAVAGQGTAGLGGELLGHLAEQLSVESVEVLPALPAAAGDRIALPAGHPLSGWIVAAKNGEMTALDIAEPS